MKLIKIISISALVLINTFSFAQKESFKFLGKKHNFGAIEEDGGAAKHTFSFINIGKEPIKIQKVKASCGCTTPAWTKTEIMPGDTGIVSASYNPKNRPGNFNKSLTITTSKKDRIILSIKGNVNPSMAKIKKSYAYKSGKLRFKNEVFDMKIVKKNGVPTIAKLPIYNESGGDIEILNEVTLPSHITLDYPQKTIKNRKSGNIQITYNTDKLDDWGIKTDEIKFKNGEDISILKIKVNIQEDFSKMTDAERANAPHINLSKTTLNFGTVKVGKTVKSKITYTNTGKTDLIIRKITSTCGCTIVKSKKNIITPGKTGKLMITVDTSDKDYNQSNMINIISNDPDSPFNSILIRANITE